MFVRLFSATLLGSLLFSHTALRLSVAYMRMHETFGHWVWPRPIRCQATLFGLHPALAVPDLSVGAFDALFVVLTSCLGAMAWLGDDAASAATSAAFAWVACVASLLYIGRVRGHGLIHNKADLIPWALLAVALCADRPGTAAFHVRLLLAVTYCSSGVIKLRITGLKWTDGRNLSRLVARFIMELGEAEPTALQRLLATSPTVCSLMQPVALLFEVTFPAVLLAPFPLLGVARAVRLAYAAVGLGFHSSCALLMRIDFLRFHALPLYWSLLVDDTGMLAAGPAVVGVPAAFGRLDCAMVCVAVTLFGWAHYHMHKGDVWPLNSYHLYSDYLADLRELQYFHLRLFVAGAGAGAEAEKTHFDCSFTSSTGIVRSYGYFHSQFSKHDKQEYFTRFLPGVLAAEGSTAGFDRVEVVRYSCSFSADNRQLNFSPVQVVEEHPFGADAVGTAATKKLK